MYYLRKELNKGPYFVKFVDEFDHISMRVSANKNHAKSFENREIIEAFKKSHDEVKSFEIIRENKILKTEIKSYRSSLNEKELKYIQNLVAKKIYHILLDKLEEFNIKIFKYGLDTINKRNINCSKNNFGRKF